MMEKVVLLICDGLGDRPVEELGGLTPLEAAQTPNLDRLARESECGMMYSLGRGFSPGSDTSHLAIMGYDPDKYYSGRGPIEVAGLGVKLREGDVALRGNFANVKSRGGKLEIVDRRTGRIRVVEPLTKSLDGMEVGGVTFIVKSGTAHRAGIVMRGEGLSSAITDGDPHGHDKHPQRVVPKDNTAEAQSTAEVLNEFLGEAHKILKGHPFNSKREQDNELPANYLLVRGAGRYRQVPSFKERYDLSACCIAGGGLYKGIGAFLGMTVLDVPGATGLDDTDIEAKFDTVLRSLDSYDFAFVHVKGADSLGEDGKSEEKRNFIARIDSAARLFEELPKNALLVVTADHSTPCKLEHHSGDPVPIMFHGPGVRVDKVSAFDERACTQGGLGFLAGRDVMPQVLNLLGTLPLTGA